MAPTFRRRMVIDRDYSIGDRVVFIEECPFVLAQKIEPESFSKAIRAINEYIADATPVGNLDIHDSMMSYLSCYLSHLFVKSQYSKSMKQLGDFIERQNMETFHRAGIHIGNPADSALIQAFLPIAAACDANIHL